MLRRRRQGCTLLAMLPLSLAPTARGCTMLPSTHCHSSQARSLLQSRSLLASALSPASALVLGPRVVMSSQPAAPQTMLRRQRVRALLCALLGSLVQKTSCATFLSASLLRAASTATRPPLRARCLRGRAPRLQASAGLRVRRVRGASIISLVHLPLKQAQARCWTAALMTGRAEPQEQPLLLVWWHWKLSARLLQLLQPPTHRVLGLSLAAPTATSPLLSPRGCSRCAARRCTSLHCCRSSRCGTRAWLAARPNKRACQGA